MILDHNGHADRRPGHTATLPMKSLPRFTPHQLLHVLSKLIAGTGAEVDLEPSLTSYEEEPGAGGVWSRASAPPAVGINLNGVTIAVIGYDRPAFDTAEIAGLDAKYWPGAHGAIGRCRAHVEVAEVHARISSDLDQNHDRALALTLVSIAVARLVDVAGIVWHASLRCLPRAELLSLADDLATGTAPVNLWVGADRFGAGDRRSAGVVTRGLYQILGAELEVGQDSFPSEVAFEIALDLAERIITDGTLPEHASRLSFGLGREFVVRHMPRGHGNDAPVLALVPDSRGLVAGAA
ncbi:MAG TPA: hypothetical protein VLA52_06625 [Thermohalobaculum sp.]|nr:hypothetical protein [Thermohalobaculum sp.]